MGSRGLDDSPPPSAGLPALGDRYRLCSRLAGGGQADIFLALAPSPRGINRLVVIKRLRPEMLDQPELVAMFLDEARLAARLNHPNVVQTYEVGGGEAYFIAMEFLEGQSFGKIRQSPAAASLGDAARVRIVADALAGLHYAHELCDFDGTPLDVVHRDVSPHNIFITYDGQIKLVDFGVAKGALNSVRTDTGVIKGKASYMAPEQVRGRADRRADIFAMGIVLWEALAGRKVFTGDNMVRVLHKVLHEPVPPLASVVPEIDPRLDAIVARAVEKDPAARYQTAHEMRDALEAYLAEAGTPVHSEWVGRWLQAAFAEDYERSRRQVQRAIEVASSAPGRPPATPPPPAYEGRGPASGPEFGVHIHPSMPGLRRPDARGQRVRSAAFALSMIAAGAAIAAATRPAPGPEGRARSAPAANDPPMPAPPAAALEVHSEPTGAAVSWDGQPLGTTPLKLELPLGLYTLLFSKNGHQTEALVIALPAPGAFVSRKVSLRPSAAAQPPPARPTRTPPLLARPARRGGPQAPPAPKPLVSDGAPKKGNAE
ncbi:MAG TPA: serine/threonine-protein kinase [Polyangiaceae bacterium]|nr:serine/threonine-protein kinase [Polyangiaceae bacterium]